MPENQTHQGGGGSSADILQTAVVRSFALEKPCVFKTERTSLDAKGLAPSWELNEEVSDDESEGGEPEEAKACNSGADTPVFIRGPTHNAAQMPCHSPTNASPLD